MGLIFGLLAVFFWSFYASFMYLGAREIGTWPSTCISTLIGGIVPLLFRKFTKGEIRSAIFLPPKLWLITIFCFVLYGVVFPWALYKSTPSQIFGVNLINYFWPVLTVIFGVLWVPNTRFNSKILIAIVLTLIGLACANFQQLKSMFSSSSQSFSLDSSLPYLLATASALSWATYSSLLARWKNWAKNYLTCGIGFILVGLTAGVAGIYTHSFPTHYSFTGILMVVLCGLGPLAGGYLAWELALARAKVQTLGLLGAVTPVLSVLLLCLFLQSPPNWGLILAAGLVSGGVLISMRS
jgi:drug/metabolite transporter (DMT)-like permease